MARAAVAVAGATAVAGAKRLVAGLDERRKAAFRRRRGRRGAQPVQLLGGSGGQEGELGRRADVRVAVDRHDLAGDGAGEGLQLVIVRLQEAPAGLGVVGEGAAAAVGEAGRAAVLQRHVLLGPEVEAEIVGIVGGDDAARRPGGRGRCGDSEKRQEEQRESSSRAPCHGVPPEPLIRELEGSSFQEGLSTSGAALAWPSGGRAAGAGQDVANVSFQSAQKFSLKNL